MKKLLLLSCLLLSALWGQAQENKGKFRHLDLALTAGSTGIGFDLAVPAGEFCRLRTGATFMPHFEYKMQFGVELLGNHLGPSTPSATGQTQAEINHERFEHLRDMLQGFTGNEISEYVHMLGKPTFNNFKFLVDLYPFDNKHIHGTVGFYAGGGRVAQAYNTYESHVSLFSVKMYNDMYWRCRNNEPIIEDFEFDPYIRNRFLEYGSMAMTVGYFKEDYYAKQDILWDHNVYMDDMDENSPTYLETVLVHAKGDVMYHEGELAYHKGDPYRMLPDEDNMVKVDAFANKIRPYVGVGYQGALTKDQRTQFSVDAGVMMWGGVPRVVTHDGIDLTHDLTQLNGHVERYVNIASKMRCWPVLELRLSHRIF